MKQKFGFLLCLVGLITFIAAGPAQAVPYATLELVDNYIVVGESFDVEVWGHADGITGDPIFDELLDFAFAVNTPGTYFSYDSYQIAPPFDDDTVWWPAGSVASSAFPGITNEDVLLATLRFNALDIGTDTLLVEGYASNFEGLGYWSGFFDIFVEIDVDVNPVPEPATMLLLGSGLIGMAAIRRRKYQK